MEEGKGEDYLILSEEERALIKEGRGLDKFKDSLTHTGEYANYKPARSLKELGDIIAETNMVLDE